MLTTPQGTTKGHEAVEAFWDAFQTAFPDNRVRLRAVLEDGEVVAEEGVFTGTNTGPMSLPDGSVAPASGAAIELPYAGVYTVRAGRIVETRYYWDQIAMLGQLGMLPPQ